MAMVLQGRDSAYETDLFAPIVSAVQSGFTGTRAGQRDIRIVADHIRASTFILSEGVVPSNEGRGYIPRRLLRKAIATGTQAGGADFDLGNVASVVIDHMRPTYPQLAVGRDRTLDLVAREQRDFGRVVRRGLDRLATLDTGPGFEVTGEDAFTLFATHGMPVALIRDSAAERGGSLDEPQFAELFAEHRELSRGTAAEPGGGPGQSARAGAELEVIAALDLPPTRFLGHHDLTAPGTVIALAGPHGRPDALTAGDSGLAGFDQTPFYAEGGGQGGHTRQIRRPRPPARATRAPSATPRHPHAIQSTAATRSPG